MDTKVNSPPIALHPGAKIKAARLAVAVAADLWPKSVPRVRAEIWESILCVDSSNPTALKMILRRVPGPCSPQKAVSSLQDSPAPQTVSQQKKPGWVLRIKASKDPETLPEKKPMERKHIGVSDKAPSSRGQNRSASGAEGDSSSCCSPAGPPTRQRRN